MLGWFVFLILPTILMVTFFVMARKLRRDYFFFLSVIMVFWIFMAGLIALIEGQLESRGWRTEFLARKQVVENYRGITQYERAAIVLEVVKLNGELKRKQYWTKKEILRPFFPKFYLDLKPINMEK